MKSILMSSINQINPIHPIHNFILTSVKKIGVLLESLGAGIYGKVYILLIDVS